MQPITAVVLGAGSRGENYASYDKVAPQDLKIVAVAEPREDRRVRLAQAHGIAPENCFSSWEELLNRPRMADAAFVCTLDDDHMAPSIRALEQGYHILLEKPMSNREDE